LWVIFVRILNLPRNGIPLMLGDGRHNSDRRAVDVRHVGGHEVNASITKVQQESRIPRQSVEWRSTYIACFPGRGETAAFSLGRPEISLRF
jgi:hypothetical protein